MRRTQIVRWVVLCLAIAGAAGSSYALDPSSCKANIDPPTGIVFFQAQAVAGLLKWGSEPGQEVFPAINNFRGLCDGANPRKCELSAGADLISPPEDCRLYLKDTGDSTTCSAWVKNCAPGRRPCPADMIGVGGICVDRYEATVWDTPTGAGTQYGVSSDDYPCDDAGQTCTNIYARQSFVGLGPSTYITWFQAQQACRNVGKRLLTSAEWQMAVSGSPDPGADNGITDCKTTGGSKIISGTRHNCRADSGVYDLVGNVDEWVAEWVPASTASPGWSSLSNDTMGLAGASAIAAGPGALRRGGGASSATAAGPMSVSGATLPSTSNSLLGFRCAR